MAQIIRKKREFKIKPFAEILVTDPGYLEDERFRNRSDLVFKEKSNFCKTGCIVIQEIEEIEPECPCTVSSINFSVILSANEEQLDVYRSDMYYKNTIIREEALGCDSACFIIGVWDKKGEYKELEFDTGADGFYGNAKKYRDGYGMRIDLCIDADMISFERIVDDMSYLFAFDKEKNKLESVVSEIDEEKEF